MFFWFIGTAVLSIVWVFRDPRFDHRLLIVGAVLPDLVDGTVGAAFGGAMVLHSVTTCVVTLAVVMGATVGKRALRSRWLGLPIGMFLHLVFDGAFDDPTVFWWPIGGLSFDDARLPIVERGWWNIPLELAGIALVAFAWRRFGLSDPAKRRWFRSTGQLLTDAAPGGPPPMC